MVGNAWLQGVGVLVNKKLNRGFGVSNNEKKLGLGTNLPEFFDAVDEIGRENSTHEL